MFVCLFVCVDLEGVCVCLNFVFGKFKVNLYIKIIENIIIGIVFFFFIGNL